jgi:signal transduction histidine kinase
LAKDSGKVRFSVTDNGQGFEVKKSKCDGATSGIGIDVMKERAESISGILNIESMPGKGTMVVLKVTL